MITAEICLSRQRAFYHKCHRCVFRGKCATWEPEKAPVAMVNVHAAEEPSQTEVTEVTAIRHRAAAKARGGKKAGRKAAASPRAAGAAALEAPGTTAGKAGMNG
jgi:hypothetical protein